MHVAYLINQYPQPSQSFIRREAAALEAAGTRVSRYTIRRPAGPAVDRRDEEERGRTRAVLDSRFGLIAAIAWAAIARSTNLLAAVALAFRLGRRGQRGVLMHLIYLAEACVIARWCHGEAVYHVHAHFGTNSTTVAMLTAALGGPGYSFTVHGPEEFDDPRGLALGEKIAHARFVVAISQFGRSQLLRWAAPEHAGKVQIVHCGLDALFLEGTTPEPAQGSTLVNVGRLVEQKGQMVLLEAAAIVARRGVPFTLNLVGDGPMRADLEDMIRRHGLGERVKLLGWQSNDKVHELLRQSRAMVMPSFAEGLPVALMESLALGRPVITTYVAGIPELVVHRENGLLVAAGDAEGLADAMVEMLSVTETELARWGEHGRAAVARRHDANTEARKLQALIARHVPSNATAIEPNLAIAPAN